MSSSSTVRHVVFSQPTCDHGKSLFDDCEQCQPEPDQIAVLLDVNAHLGAGGE